MSITGSLLFFIPEDAGTLSFEIIEQAHEMGEGLTPLF